METEHISPALEEEFERIQPIIYNDNIDVSSIRNIMLIDSNLIDNQVFYDSANSNTFPIRYSYTSQKTELLELLRNKFQNGIDRISFVFHDPSVLEKGFLDNKCFFVKDDLLEGQTTFSENVLFLTSLANEFRIAHLDFLACNTLKYDIWKQYYELLNRLSGVICGASNDATGNLHYGGDWLMENTNENVRDIYFNSNIDNYASTLAATTISSNGGTIYIQQDSGTLAISYSINSVTGPYTSIGSNYPINIQNTSINGTVLTVQFITDITINNVNQYFVCASNYITFNGLYNDSKKNILFYNVSNYLGFIQNGINETITNKYHTITIQNITTKASTGSTGSTLATKGAWLCQGFFGASINSIPGFDPSTNLIKILNNDNLLNINNTQCGSICGTAFCSNGTGLIDNCTNSATISGSSASGICGSHVGQKRGNVTITNCTNSATISGSFAGGICGSDAGFTPTGQVGGNVTITNCTNTNTNSATISGTSAGGICGAYACVYSSGTVTITNCTNSARVSGTRAGGICGGNAGYSATVVGLTITNCTNSATISGALAGGICGGNASQVGGKVTITNCTNTNTDSATISGSGAGGICGGFSGNGGTVTITNCTNSATISSSGLGAGGICGERAGAENGTVTINKCYNAGNNNGNSSGGITGNRFGYNTNKTCSISNCYNTGTIGGTNNGGICGGLVGNNISGTVSYIPIINITRCYTLGTIATTCGGILGGSSLTTYNNVPTVTLTNCYTSGSVTDAGSGLISNSLQASIKSIVTVTNCYIANGSWSDISAYSSLIGAPIPPDKIGTIWYSNQINTPYYLVYQVSLTIIQSDNDLQNYMSSTILFGEIVNNLSTPISLVASSNKILLSNSSNLIITKT